MIFSLGSTLYKIPDNSEEKIFLNKYIKLHKIWKKYEIWKGLIKYSINEEMHNQKNFNGFSDNNKNKKERIDNIVKVQIISFLYNIFYFDIKNNIVNDIISEFQLYYDLNKDIIDEFNKIIECKKNDNINNNDKLEINKNENK